MANFNRFELEAFAKRAADAYLQKGVPLNQSITKMASDQDMNADQIQRVVENSNILVNGTLVKRARLEKKDPRITFERASSQAVGEKLASQSESAQVKEARAGRRFQAMFKIAEPSVNTQDLLDRTVGPLVDDHYGVIPTEVDPHQLAVDYVSGGEMHKCAEAISAHSLNLACEKLEEVMVHAREKRSHVLFAAEKMGHELKDSIKQHLATGTSPATLRDVVKNAGINGYMQQIADVMISDLAKVAEMREGQSVIGERTLVNTDHPIISGLRKLAQARNDLDEARSVEQKVSTAYRLARRDLTRAAGRG